MANIGALLLVLGVAVFAYVVVRRPRTESLAGPTGFWTWACVAIFASGFCTLAIGDYPWCLPVGYALGTAYPALLLSGALAYAGRRVPLWIVAGGGLVGFARGLLALGGAPGAAQGIALAVEPTAIVFAAVVAFRNVRWETASTPERWLAPGLLAMAAIEAMAAILQLLSRETPLEVQVAFLLGSPLLLALQIAAVARRAEVALRRSRQELERRVDERTAELRASEERYRIVSELSSDYSFALRMTPDYRDIEFEWVTDGLERITGYAPRELERDAWLSRMRLEDGGSLIDLVGRILAGEVREFEIQIATRSGEWRDLLGLIYRFDSRPDGMIRLVGAGRDITERKRAQAEAHQLELHLQEAQRVESLAMLAGGIAHDFNNMLAVILGNARLAREELAVGTPPGKRLDRIETAASHATRLTQQLLTYSGTASVSLRPLDVSALVRDLADLIQVSMAEQGRVEFALADDLPAVEADATQIRQVVLNLVTNAAESFEGGGGCVRVRTELVDLDAGALADAVGGSEARPGPYVALEVSDDGPGLAADVAPLVFEPFFTTKPAGNGLGLAAVLGIVRAHRGVIQLASRPGAGTSFRVLLPASTLPIRSDEPPVAPRSEPALRGRVLLVDDDDSVREVARAFLERAGFEVWTAGGGRAAIDLFSTRAAQFDVVVLDLRMPDVGGERAFLELRRIRPDLPVVLTSGFDERRAAQRFSARGVAAFVGKPFEPEALVEAVRRAMTRATNGALY
jgi:PAS domain S-box-containing protein